MMGPRQLAWREAPAETFLRERTSNTIGVLIPSMAHLAPDAASHASGSLLPSHVSIPDVAFPPPERGCPDLGSPAPPSWECCHGSCLHHRLRRNPDLACADTAIDLAALTHPRGN